MYFDQRKSDILIKQTHKNISARQSCRLVAQSFFFFKLELHILSYNMHIALNSPGANGSIFFLLNFH